MEMWTETVSNQGRRARREGGRTNEILTPDVGGAVEVEQYGEVVGVVGGVELGHVEQALAGQTVVKVAGVEGGIAADVELARDAVDSIAINVDGIDGRHNQ